LKFHCCIPKLAVFTTVKIQVVVFCVVKPCRIVVGHHIHPEDGDSKALRSVGILTHHYPASQP